jgi:ribulose-phosphate 3-epimerase
MPTPFLIAPSILSADFANLGDQIAQAEAAGADWIHIDVMDGHFVPNLTMGPVVVDACRRITKLPLDVHLMVNSPEKLLEAFAKAGADSLTVHIEAVADVQEALQTIKQLGCKVGLALNPDTPASDIETALPMLDLALVMTVNPGYSGQAFIAESLPKIAAIRQMLDDVNPEADVQVDGGIDPKTLPDVKNAGANVFVAGSAIFNHSGGIAAGVQSLKDALDD